MKPDRVSLAQLGLIDQGPIPLVEAAGQHGFQAVGVPLRSGALKPLRYEIVGNTPLIREIKAACRAHGVGVFDVEALVLGHEPPVEELCRIFETASELGASRISCLGYEAGIGPGSMTVGSEPERLAQICRVAREFDLCVGVEFMLFRSIRTLGDAKKIVLKAGEPNARIIIDLLHLHRTGGTVQDVADLPKELLSHVQLCDATAEQPAIDQLAAEARGGRLLPGDGVIPLRPLIDELPPESFFSLEIPVQAHADLPIAERVRRGADALGRL